MSTLARDTSLDPFSVARRIFADEKQRQHILAEQNERLKQSKGLAVWQIEDYARQEREARVREHHMGELLRALPKERA